MIKLRFKPEYLIYLFFAAFYLLLAFQLPYAHDDWDWGLSNGITQLVTANLNGRYAGNLFEVIMTRSELLKTVIMGACCFLIAFIPSKLASRKITSDRRKFQVVAFLVANCLVLTMSHYIWQQTYGWVAGFANFVISCVFLSVWIYEIFRTFDEKIEVEKNSALSVAGSFAVAVIGQLFLENIAIYCFALSVVLCLVRFLRVRHIPLKNIFMLLGSVVGLVITFSSSLYGTLFSTGQAIDGYRKLTIFSDSGVKGVVDNVVLQIYKITPRVINDNVVLCVFILVVLTMLVFSKKRSLKKSAKIVFLCLNTVMVCYFAANCIGEKNFGFSASVGHKIVFAFNVMYICLVSFEILAVLKKEKWFKFKLLAFWLSAFAVIAPIIVTTEAGNRLFFVSNFFFIIFAVTVLADVFDAANIKLKYLLVALPLIAATALSAYYINMYAEIGECKKQRENIIEQAVENGDETIVLPDFPHKDYMWNPNPNKPYRWEYFKAFYGIPPETEVIIK